MEEKRINSHPTVKELFDTEPELMEKLLNTGESEEKSKEDNDDIKNMKNNGVSLEELKGFIEDSEGQSDEVVLKMANKVADFSVKIEFKHEEAFCVMSYQCEKCGFHEQIWNSRDGVTPFIVGCLQCDDGSMQHVDWNSNVRKKNWYPLKGQRVFVDMSRERFDILIRARVRFFWDSDDGSDSPGFRRTYGSMDKAFEALRSSGEFQPGIPDVMIIQ